jgi:hypothetical protein
MPYLSKINSTHACTFFMDKFAFLLRRNTWARIMNYRLATPNTDSDCVSGDDDDSTSKTSSSNSSDTLIDKPKKMISLHYVKKLEKQLHSLDNKMKKADYKSVE